MSKDWCFKLSGAPGPDYKCGKCNAFGIRLWRGSGFTLDSIDLFCAECAEDDQAKQLASDKASGLDDPERENIGGTIGNLLPARPTDDGSSLWGHSSGDSAWWYRLQQYRDPTREAMLIRAERDYFAQQQQYWAGEYMKASEKASVATRERNEAFRVAKLAEYPE